MNNEACWRCANPVCEAERWLVQAVRDQRELWQIAADLGRCAWTVAAALPICPLCGSTSTN